MEATQTAWSLYETWRHLPRGECFDQIEWHMESDGFSSYEIGCALDEIDAATFS